MAGRRFTDLGDLNRQARQWCDEQNRRIHGTTGERPIDRLAQENLKALLPKERLAKYRFELRKASRDGFVSYDGVRYGIPWQYSGREVKVREIGEYVEIYWENRLIAGIGSSTGRGFMSCVKTNMQTSARFRGMHIQNRGAFKFPFRT